MSSFTDFGEALVANFIRGQGLSLPANFQVALLEAVDEDGTYTEVSWTGYERLTAARSLTAWSGTQGAGTTLASTGASHQTSNNAALDFGTVGSGGSATITHLGLFLDDSNDDLFVFAELQTPLVVGESDPVSFGAGSVACTLGLTGGLSDYLSNRLIDLIWRAQAFSMPANGHHSLFTAAPTNAGGGTEVAGGSYARVSVPLNSANWDLTGGLLENANTIQFANPTANWGTVLAAGIHDAASGGNLLFWQALVTPKSIAAGASAPRFSAGQRSIEIR
jgi:hypothetical protein